MENVYTPRLNQLTRPGMVLNLKNVTAADRASNKFLVCCSKGIG